jgi:hypothetical protein
VAETISAHLEAGLADKARRIARAENRTVSNYIAGAVGVFSDFPKELRDMLLELRTSDDDAFRREATRELLAVAARLRFDRATARLAEEDICDPRLKDASDDEILEAATRLVRGG